MLKLRKDKTERAYLAIDELERLANKEFSSERLERMRDIKKYEPLRKGNLVFPVYSNQKSNDYPKEIACGCSFCRALILRETIRNFFRKLQIHFRNFLIFVPDIYRNTLCRNFTTNSINYWSLPL